MAVTPLPRALVKRPGVSTTDVLRARHAEGSLPGHRQDPWTVALAVEGGGMRGVISSGMLLALEQLGLRKAVDLIVGTSAGAIAAAFFLIDRGAEGAPIYFTELNQPPFLNPRRLIRLQPAMDIDYLIDDALPRRGFDPDRLTDSPIPLYATVTAVDPDNPTTLLQVTGSPDRVRAILKATASLPVLGGASKLVDGEEYVDGGLESQLPWRAALDQGATHVLALPTRPVLADDDRTGSNMLERSAVRTVVRRMHGDHVADRLEDASPKASVETAALRALADGTASWVGDKDGYPSSQPYVEVVDLDPTTELPDRMESERPVLAEAMAEGAEAVVQHFEVPDVRVVHQIALSHPSVEVSKFISTSLRPVMLDRDVGS